MTSPSYRTLEMKKLDPDYLSAKFHDHDIISLEFTGHSLHPSFPKNMLKCKKAAQIQPFLRLKKNFAKKIIFEGALAKLYEPQIFV